MKNVRKSVFLSSIFILVLAVILNMISPVKFIDTVTTCNVLIGENFGFIFNLVGLFMVIICVYVYFSPLGNYVIGGKDAKPILSKWNWFAITLCTTIAAGILFWSAAEPIIHLSSPPDFLGIAPNSYDASIFSMSTMYLHWGITPYAIYCVPAIMFAFAYYNMKKSYSFNSCLIPLLGDRLVIKSSQFVDSLCLFITGTGLAASLGMGILSVSGGLSQIFSIKSTPSLWLIVGILIVSAFVISSTSGLMKGIKILSDINTKIFFALLLFAFLFGPTSFICSYALESFGSYISLFFEKSLMLGAATTSTWSREWTIQYLASWLAWAPMTALFLGKIAYGYKFKDFILVNLVLPASFSMIWVSILGGNAVFRHLNTENLMEFINVNGIESALYEIFRYLPFDSITMLILVVAVFLSFVTAADSTTNAMANLCVNTNSDNKTVEPPAFIKIVWGVLIGSVSLIMITGKGVDGVKILSTLAGFPATIILFLVGISLVKVAKSPDKFININKTEERSNEKSTI